MRRHRILKRFTKRLLFYRGYNDNEIQEHSVLAMKEYKEQTK